MDMLNADLEFYLKVGISSYIVRVYAYMICKKSTSALNTAGTVAAGQLLHLGHGDHVVVTLNGVLQSGSGNCEFHCRLSILAGQQGVDQAAAEGVTAAHAVDDVQVVLLGEAVLILGNVVQHGAPAVVEGGVGLTQGDGNHLEAELVSQLLGRRGRIDDGSVFG